MNTTPKRPAATDDDLAGALIEGKTFKYCSLFGPCVVMLMDGCTLEDSQLGDAGGDPKNLFLSPIGPRVTGALIFSGCTFQNCQFYNVGFTGTPEELNTMLISAMGRGA